MSSNLIIWIPLLPLLGALINGLLGKHMPRWAVSFIGCSTIGLSFVFSIIVFKLLDPANAQSSVGATLISNWIFAEKLSIPVAFVLDRLSAIMILVVSGVSFLIHVYSIGYMRHDKGYARYFSYLNLFCFSMLLLVLSDNLLVMFVGWEGVGLCSYLLIGFWFEDMDKAIAGKKAFIVNRIGDFGFILGIFFTYYFFQTLNFSDLALSISEFHKISTVPIQSVATLICILLFIGACGKSAQIPLYVWLPDAMAGPTPVSALIHAATMVTAGIYMIGRMYFLFDLAPAAQELILAIGTLTAFFAATIAIVQNDIKKVLAYSTISQLGYMFMAMGAGAYFAGIFHLATHAFFKALLFLGAGSVIHILKNEQDIRKMGGMKNYMVLTTMTFGLATFAISGFPLLFSGWYSKDRILLEVINSHHTISFFAWVVGVITAMLTAFYMFRLFCLVFMGTTRVQKDELKNLHESPPSMTVPMIILAILSVTGGWFGIDKFLIAFFPEISEHHEAGLLGNHYFHAFLVSTLSVAAMAFAIFVYTKRRDIAESSAKKFSKIYDILSKKYMVDEFYEVAIVKPFVVLSKIFAWFDKWIVDGLVNLSAYMVKAVSFMTSRIQTGLVQVYAVFVIAGLIFILGYLFWTG